MSVVVVVCWQVEVSVTGRSLVQRSPTEYGVTVCDHEASTMRSLWPTGGCRAIRNTLHQLTLLCKMSCLNKMLWCECCKLWIFF